MMDPGAKEMNLHRMVTNHLPLHAHLLEGDVKTAMLFSSDYDVILYLFLQEFRLEWDTVVSGLVQIRTVVV